MNADQKAKAARIIGIVCIVTGTVNLILTVTGFAGDETLMNTALLTSGVSALMLGIIMLALGRRSTTSQGRG
jgi:hypothetical protein